MNEEHSNFVKELSKRVYDNANKKAETENYSIDPLTLLTIASIIIQVVKIILEWYNNKKDKAAESIKSLGFFKKAILWRMVKKEFKNDDRKATYIYNGLINEASNLSEEERLKLFN